MMQAYIHFEMHQGNSKFFDNCPYTLLTNLDRSHYEPCETMQLPFLHERRLNILVYLHLFSSR